MKQIEAVMNVVVSFTSDEGIAFEEGSTKLDFNKSQLDSMTAMLVASFEAGDIEIKSEKESARPAAYLRSMLRNHLRKDSRLNGGEKYSEIKTEGKKRITDPTLKELKKLLTAVTAAGNAESIAAVQAEHDKQLAIVEAAKNKAEAIDAGKLPESLRHLVPSA